MPRNISVGFEEAIEDDGLRLALCVKVTRKDSTVFGYTSIDTQFDYDGVTYYPDGSSEASSIKSAIGSGVDNMEIIGLIMSDDVTDRDIRAGLFNSARIEVFEIFPDHLEHGRVVLLSGIIGEITLQDGKYVAEVRSKTDLLKQQVGPQTTSVCRCKRLGDAQCKVVIASYTFSRTLDTVTDPTHLVFAGDVHATDYYTYGVVKFTSGVNSGLEREIKAHTLNTGKAELTLRLPFPFTPSVGDTADLEAGCQRRKDEDCYTKFDNAINFHGECRIPGNEVIGKQGRHS